MKEHDYLDIVPVQFTGKQVEANASVECTDEKEAKAFYDVVKKRLLDVNNWHHVAGIISAKFRLVDSTGREVERHAEKGDYLKIDIPGPGSNEGDGYDWVCIEELKEITARDFQSTGFRVRPSHNPLGDKKETAHFYSDESTSAFIVIREGHKVIAWIVDRNIKPNNEADLLTDKIRDTTIGIGAISMFSKIQWEGLSKGLVKHDS